MRRGLAASRGEAQRLIDGGSVLVGGRPSARAATMVAPDEPIHVTGDEPWASRAGEKLDAALDAFDIAIEGRRCLDVGASTGGFTDVLLSRGASQVLALDVGYGQLIWRLRTDPRVTVLDRTNFRTIDVAELGGPFDVVTADVSFISLRLLADNLAAVGGASSDYLLLVKPQFEVGKDKVGRGGVVRDPALHREAVESVAAALADRGLTPLGLITSPITGAEGNTEFVLWLRKAAPVQRPGLDALLAGVDL